MAQIALQNIVLSDVNLTLGTDDYRKHVSAVEFVPSASLVNWKGLGKNSFTGVAAATWQCNLSYAQDWETPNSLSRYLYDHEGQTIPCTFEPVDGGLAWEADIVITPGSIGGAVDSVAVGTVSLGVDGKPTPAA